VSENGQLSSNTKDFKTNFERWSYLLFMLEYIQTHPKTSANYVDLAFSLDSENFRYVYDGNIKYKLSNMYFMNKCVSVNLSNYVYRRD
jgi:hypothetical protein